MTLQIITAEDFAKEILECANGHCYNALDVSTTQGMTTVKAVFTAQASSAHGQFVIRFEKTLGHYPFAAGKAEFPAAQKRAAELETVMRERGLVLPPGMWKP